jgi:hypothetical protein
MSLQRDIIFKILQDLDPISYYKCICISKNFYPYNNDIAKNLYLKNRCIGHSLEHMINTLDIEGVRYIASNYREPFNINLQINDNNIEKISEILKILNTSNNKININIVSKFDGNQIVKLSNELYKFLGIAYSNNVILHKVYSKVLNYIYGCGNSRRNNVYIVTDGISKLLNIETYSKFTYQMMKKYIAHHIYF